MEGMMVAYGGDPAGSPGSNGKGSVNLSSTQVQLTFDPTYLNQLATKLPGGFTLKTLSWSQLP